MRNDLFLALVGINLSELSRGQIFALCCVVFAVIILLIVVVFYDDDDHEPYRNWHLGKLKPQKIPVKKDGGK